jgi:hypothetical protein
MKDLTKAVSLVSVLLLTCACSTPMGVTHVDTQSMYRSMTSSVLSADRPSHYSGRRPEEIPKQMRVCALDEGLRPVRIFCNSRPLSPQVASRHPDRESLRAITRRQRRRSSMEDHRLFVRKLSATLSPMPAAQLERG